jgi:hypothetical protein
MHWLLAVATLASSVVGKRPIKNSRCSSLVTAEESTDAKHVQYLCTMFFSRLVNTRPEFCFNSQVATPPFIKSAFSFAAKGVGAAGEAQKLSPIRIGAAKSYGGFFFIVVTGLVMVLEGT